MPAFRCLGTSELEQLTNGAALGRPAGLLVLTVEQFYPLQKIYGDVLACYVADLARRTLAKAAEELLGDAELLIVERVEADSFALLFSKEGLDLDALPDLAISFKVFVRNGLNREFMTLTGQRVELRLGYALLGSHPCTDIRAAIFRALCDAKEVAMGALEYTSLRHMQEFREVLEIPRLRMVYQPIMDLRSGEVLGWEALARGPEDSHFRSPLALFDFAEEVGSLFALEKVCRELAIQNLGDFKEIARRSQLGDAITLIYVDLDHFKVYNDHYGFKDGDRVLLLLARLLTRAVKKHGSPEDFLGHVGGDDFVLITQPGCAERIAKTVVRCFKRLIPHYYTQEARQRGTIQGKDRNGHSDEFPLVSVSIAILDCFGPAGFEDIARRTAEMKHYAKSLPGNVYVRDRRSGRVVPT